MDNQFITLYGDLLSGNEIPERVKFVKFPTDEDSGLIVYCRHASESKMSQIGKSVFLDSHPELRHILTRMQVGDVAKREDTTDGPSWTIKDHGGAVRETVLLPDE